LKKDAEKRQKEAEKALLKQEKERMKARRAQLYKNATNSTAQPANLHPQLAQKKSCAIVEFGTCEWRFDGSWCLLLFAILFFLLWSYLFCIYLCAHSAT
jgi:hypothetical protein